MAVCRRAQLAVDSSGPALKAAIELGVDLIKLNEHELADALGLADAQPETVMAAVDSLSVETIILSMGCQGALFVSGMRRSEAKAPALEVMSTVGAGDSCWRVIWPEGLSLRKEPRRPMRGVDWSLGSVCPMRMNFKHDGSSRATASVMVDWGAVKNGSRYT